MQVSRELHDVIKSAGASEAVMRKLQRIRTTNIAAKPKENTVQTLSIPSSSRPLFVPRGPGGTAELRSSLPLAEDPVRSEPYGRFFCEVDAGFPVAARRCASMSFFKLFASSLFSSVSLRRRSCGTQSSQLEVQMLAVCAHISVCKNDPSKWSRTLRQISNVEC